MVSVWYASSAVASAGSRHFSYEQQWSRPPIQEDGTINAIMLWNQALACPAKGYSQPCPLSLP